MKIAGYEIDCIDDGAFFMDGSSLFGCTPYLQWAGNFPPDENNRILVPSRCYLLRGNGRSILVDTGFGAKPLPKDLQRLYARNDSGNLLLGLKAVGVAPDDITDVINTHLHFSHCGWNTGLSVSGRLSPVFCKARYWIQSKEWKIAQRPHALASYCYNKCNFEILEREADLRLLQGDFEIAPNIRVEVIGGHTGADQIVMVQDSRSGIAITADFIPTLFHLNPKVLESGELFPTLTHDSKLAFLKKAAAGNWMIALPHDPVCTIALVEKGRGGWIGKQIETRPLDPWE